MPATNPKVTEQLKQAKEDLERAKSEKTRLYPPNPHPLAEADRYPRDFTPEQIRQRNELTRKIEALEQQIENLQDQLYQK